MGLIKTLAKTYGNYFLTMQGVKVMKTMRRENEIFLGNSCHYFYQTDYWNCEILLDAHLFCSSIIVLQAII